jgi:putative Holliday junction resolvase
MTGSSETADSFPTQGRLLGLDYGTKRIGVAVSNDGQSISSPIENYTRRDAASDSDFLKYAVEEYQAVGIIVGLPVHMSGDEGGKAREARKFGEWVSRTVNRPVRYWDERFTSLLADERLRESSFGRKKQKARRDKMAAQILLQSYLDSPHKDRPPTPLGE